eukprot:PITA_01063
MRPSFSHFHPYLSLRPPAATIVQRAGDFMAARASLRLYDSGQLKASAHDILDPNFNFREAYTESSKYVSLLQDCQNKKALPYGKLLHAHIIQTGSARNFDLENVLVVMYAKCGSLMDARRALAGETPNRSKSLLSWTALISAYTKNGQAEEALTLFNQMQQTTGFQPDHFTCVSLLSACASAAALEHGKEVHAHIIRSGFLCNVFVGSSMVDMYVKCGNLKDARKLFDKMPAHNVVSWTAMVAGYAQNGCLEEALELFRKMPERNAVSWNAMIAGYARQGNINEALMFFREMPSRNVVSWTSMVAGYMQNGHFDEALMLFRQMPQRDVVAWNLIIAGYAQNGYVDDAMEVFHNIPEKTVASWNSMIAGYAQNGRVDEALDLFREMPNPDVISWNHMIAGYTQNGYCYEALKLFQQMQLTDTKPNAGTMAGLLPACANLATLEIGKEIHQRTIRRGFQCDVFVGSALVDMYSKCGSLEDARKVFDRMPMWDAISWNAVIWGYAMHGFAKEALQLFDQMERSGTSPDSVTFVGVLGACSHAGLVDVGWKYFEGMRRDYHIIPAMEHYCSMVDLLGRAGHLDEAFAFINKMPLKPNATVWASLLGACRVHGKVELAQHLAHHLFHSDSKNPAHYVLLSNIYAAAGRWEDVEKVRQVMKYKTVNKMPGCSWIEINKQRFAFVGGDITRTAHHTNTNTADTKEAKYFFSTPYMDAYMTFLLGMLEIFRQLSDIMHVVHMERLFAWRFPYIGGGFSILEGVEPYTTWSYLDLLHGCYFASQTSQSLRSYSY